MQFDIVDKLAIGNLPPSERLLEEIYKELSAKIGLEKIIKTDIINSAEISYEIYLAKFKKHIKQLHLRGLRNTLAALDRIQYYKRHPEGRDHLDEILTASEKQVGLQLDREQKDLGFELFSVGRTRALSLTIESVIFYSKGNLNKRGCSDNHLIETVWLAEQVHIVANVKRIASRVSPENYEYIQLTHRGEIEFKYTENMIKQAIRAQEIAAMENRDIATMTTENSEVDSVFEEANRLDKIMGREGSRSSYKTLKCLLSLVKDMRPCYRSSKPAYTCLKKRSDLIRLLQKSTGFELIEVIEIFKAYSLTHRKLASTPFPEWHAPRDVTVYIKPLLNFDLNGEPVVLFSEFVVWIASSFLLSHPFGVKDRTHGDPRAEAYKKELTEKFEHDVVSKFRKFGFDVYPNINITKKIGEIDLIAIHPNTETAILVECKAPKIRMDSSSFVEQLEIYQKWKKKLDRKTEYSERNFCSIHGFNKFTQPKKIISIIVSQRPWYKPLNVTPEIIHILGLDSWISNILSSA